MVDLPSPTYLLPAVDQVGRAWKAVVRLIPGLKEDAPKRNFVLLIVYLELALLAFGLSHQLL